MQKITPFLWFNDNAEEAVNFYTSVFKNSKILKTTYYNKSSARASGRPEGSVMSIEFTLDGQEFIALNGGPHFSFSPAISFLIKCKTQQEVDQLWAKLSQGGKEEQCGWLMDKYGLSWQVVPVGLNDMLDGGDSAKSNRVTDELLKMNKIEISILREAYERA
ncbi:MAG: VOC family protein [candidate division Zixibacteria bacterium]|nr:VOC family protein [candidate division Zixibacteria bacterium]NIR66372.1 VOC family protein [candidate division Zixibacteria bacterium]NIS17993.1 VOC family protein [candidate division Zixibacteria bacterium]NIS47974.1 VOC family protein [candidate division Zixibacteria bacterium]NIT54276.1 VOC family protein [candidate division Zixibacteria bacterium]